MVRAAAVAEQALRARRPADRQNGVSGLCACMVSLFPPVSVGAANGLAGTCRLACGLSREPPPVANARACIRRSPMAALAPEIRASDDPPPPRTGARRPPG